MEKITLIDIKLRDKNRVEYIYNVTPRLKKYIDKNNLFVELPYCYDLSACPQEFKKNFP